VSGGGFSTPTPRLLDLFCGAGGAAAGYARAGFEVVGVDIAPQDDYPFNFFRRDALDWLKAHGRNYDAIHASPPCQAHTSMSNRWRGQGGKADSHDDLIAATRALASDEIAVCDRERSWRPSRAT
jgi:DNA (cytosine-5)-methyltransferase 1